MAATIITDYKQLFFWKRFPQTVFGGAKLKLGYDAPMYIYSNQMLLFVTPFLIGAIFTLLVEFDVLANKYACPIYGCIIFLFVLIGQVFSYRKTSNSFASTNDEIGIFNGDSTFQQNAFSDEDEIDFQSCLSPESINFVLPMKKFRANILIHSLLSGPLCGLGLQYLLPSTLDSLYNNAGATVVLFIFGWFTVCVAQYSLTVTSPPEPATFNITDPYELRPLMRPYYVYTLFAFHIVHLYDEDFELVDEILHIVFIFLPLLWTLGALPPLDALFPWLMEQCIVVLGGSPMAGDIRLIIMFLTSAVTFVGMLFLAAPIGTSYLALLAACIGYCLSLNHSSLINQLISKRTNTSTSDITTPRISQRFGWHWGMKELLFYVFMLSVIIGIFFLNYHNYESPDDINHTLIKVFGYITIGLLILVKLFGEIQCVYTLFGLWRNYFFPHSVFKLEQYSNRKSILMKVAVLRRIILDIVAPVIMVQYLFLVIMADTNKHSFIRTLGIVRAFRWVWQGTFTSMVELSIFHVINQVLMPTSGWWYDLGSGPQLLFLGLLWNRSNNIIDKVYSYLTVLITMHTYKKQQPTHSTLIIILNVICFPVVLFVILLAAILSAPLLPLFTLPILLVGFPRPMRNWPGKVGGSANISTDTIYYEQLSSRLTVALNNSCKIGSLGNLYAGAQFFARFQDRIVWLQVLECGYGYCCLSMKGLELLETSCHTEEATKVDEIFEKSFESDRGFSVLNFSEDPFHVLTPVDAFPVDTYSSAKTVLTGLIESPDTLQSIGKNFWKSLIWVLLRHIVQREKVPSSKPTSPRVNNVEDKRVDQGNVGSRTILLDVKEKTSLYNVKDEKDSGRATGETSRPVTATSRQSHKSLALSWGSLNSWNDDDSLEEVPIGKNSGHKIPLSNLPKGQKVTLPGTVNDVDDVDQNLEDILNDLAIGLPPVDVGDKTANNFSDLPTKLGSIKLAGSIQFSSPHSSKLSLPLKWRDIPLNSQQISSLLSDFPKDWYRHVVEHLNLSSGVPPSSDVVDAIISDEALTSIYTQLVSAIYSLVNSRNLSGMDFVNKDPMHVFRVFSGRIPSSIDWITQDEELYNLVIKAYRYAVKMSFDEVVYGEASDENEVREYLEEYESDWYLGLESDEEWKMSVLNEKPRLFSIGCDLSTNIPCFSSHTLTRQPTMVSIGRLNAEIIRAVWAAQALELFYFTNDDEERYSIQAHPTILRNLTVQAADPPLGYPIYYSKPISIPTF